MKYGKDLKVGEVIRPGVPFSRWYGQIETIEPHASWQGWTVAHFRNARSMTIEPNGVYYVK